MLKILFATNHAYLPQRAGGSESSTHDLCLSLLRREVSVAVLAHLEPHDLLGLSTRLRRKIGGSGPFPVDETMGYPVYRGWKPGTGIRDIVQEYSPDIVVIQAGHPMTLAYSVLEAQVPCIVYFRDIEFDQLGGSIPTNTAELGYVANSNYTAACFRQKFGIEPTVIPPLVNPERYYVERKGASAVFVNPKALKGLDIAFELAEKRPDIPFEFVESWPLTDEEWKNLRSRARELGNVRLRKRVLDMRRVYRRAKLILVPSIWPEAWARVVTEAQLSAIPVLASDRAGLPESVGGGGMLVDPDTDISVWQESLSRLWDDPDEYERYSRAALDHARRLEIQPEHLVSKFLEVVSSHLRRVSLK